MTDNFAYLNELKGMIIKMKRIISTILILCLVVSGATVFAQPVEAGTRNLPRVDNTSNLRLNHADIEQLVLRNNPVVRNNAITQQGLNDMIGTPRMTDALIAGQNQLLAMQAHTNAILTSIMAMPVEGPDPVRDGIIMSLVNDIASSERDIMQLSAQIDQMNSDPVRNTFNRSVMQINNANRQVIWGVESLYLAYHTLTRQLEQALENLTTLNSNIDVMERRHAVGHVTERAVQNVRNSRTQLEVGIVTMKNELGNIRSQINTLLGRDFDAPLQIGVLPEPDRAFLNSRDAARDLRDARGTNAALNIARIDMDEQSQLWGEDARRQEALARNNYESEIRALAQRMDSLSRAINERITTLELAEEQLDFLRQTFEETQRRYSRGLVSRVELGQARSEVSLQEIRVASADAELFGAIRRYEWFVRGLNT